MRRIRKEYVRGASKIITRLSGLERLLTLEDQGAPVLASHADDELSNLSPDSRPPRIGAVLGAVKLLSDEPLIPRKDGVGLSHPRDLLQRFATEPPTDLGQGRPLRIS
jgi:hypothetical protein